MVTRAGFTFTDSCAGEWLSGPAGHIPWRPSNPRNAIMPNTQRNQPNQDQNPSKQGQPGQQKQPQHGKPAKQTPKK